MPNGSARCCGVAPFDRAEAAVACPGVIQSDRAHRLLAIAQVRIVCLAMRQDVLEGHGMMAVYAHRERRVEPLDVLETAALRRGGAAHVVFAAGDFEVGPLAKDQLAREQSLRGCAV